MATPEQMRVGVRGFPCARVTGTCHCGEVEPLSLCPTCRKAECAPCRALCAAKNRHQDRVMTVEHRDTYRGPRA